MTFKLRLCLHNKIVSFSSIYKKLKRKYNIGFATDLVTNMQFIITLKSEVFIKYYVSQGIS